MFTTAQNNRLTQGLLTYTPLIFALGMCLFLFSGDWLRLLESWNQQDFSHGPLIVPISLWLIYRQRRALSESLISPSFFGCICLILSLGIWTIGKLTSTPIVVLFSIILIIQTVVLTFIGWAATKKIFFPLIFLTFMLPMGGGLTPMLIDGTASAITASLNLFGIPVYRQAAELILPSGRWSVVAACSGLRYILAGVILATVFAHLNFKGLPRKAAFVGAAIFFALIANWVRATLIVLMGHFTQMKYGTGDEHIWLGWIFFGIVNLFVFWLGTKWFDNDEPDRPATNQIQRVTYSTGDWCIALASILLLIAIGHKPIAIAVDTEPALRAWESIEQTFGKQSAQLPFEAPSEGALRKHQIKLLPNLYAQIALYGDQAKNGAMVRQANDIIPDQETSKWRLLSSARLPISISDGKTVNVNEINLINGSSRIRIIHWFSIGNHNESSQYWAKLRAAINLVLFRKDFSISNVIIETDLPEGDIVMRPEYIEKMRLLEKLSISISSK